MATRKTQEWLLMFYSVPSQPVSNRMKIWRKLANAGAVQLKGSVYLLPSTEEHEEFLNWIIGEVKSMGGDGAFVRTTGIMTMDDHDVKKLFIQQAEHEYAELEKGISVLERKLQSVGTKSANHSTLDDQLSKITKEMAAIDKRDFFSSPSGENMRKRIKSVENALRTAGRKTVAETTTITLRRTQDYQGRTWVTRKNPFVDRMASAWLIKRFIDPRASFRFIDERDLAPRGKATVAFDVRRGEFTHVGDLSTFEVLVRSFMIKDRAIKKIAEIVHDLDVMDGKYGRPEATGVENILAGIRKTATNDADGLERGMAVFEMLYQSKS